MFKISIKSTSALSKLSKFYGAFSQKRSVLMGKISKEIAVRLQKKFHSNGGEKWWKDAANSIYKSNTETSANVVAKQTGVALQRYGGTVRPKTCKNLAIPLRKEFKGKYPSELTGKKLFAFGARRAFGKAFLAYKDGKSVKVAYLLTPKAVIKPHPDKFLSDNEILSAANEIVELYTKKSYGLSI